MDILEALLIITDVTKGKTTRTVIQKLCYFLKVKGIIHVKFRPHYYGPYSSEIQDSLSALVGLEFIDEACERSSYSQWKKYTYTPADDGRKILEALKNTPEYNKTKKIIEKCRENSNMNVKQISEKAKTLGWEVNEQSRRKAVNLLKALGLVSLN